MVLWLTILGILYIGISSVIQPLGCSLHSTKLSDQVYLYQADFRHSYCQRMMYRTLWEPWEATALLIQWLQPKVDPLSPQNQLRQAHLRFHQLFLPKVVRSCNLSSVHLLTLCTGSQQISQDCSLCSKLQILKSQTELLSTIVSYPCASSLFLSNVL